MLEFWNILNKNCHKLAKKKSNKIFKLGMLRNPQNFLLKMGTEIFKIDAPWEDK